MIRKNNKIHFSPFVFSDKIIHMFFFTTYLIATKFKSNIYRQLNNILHFLFFSDEFLDHLLRRRREMFDQHSLRLVKSSLIDVFTDDFNNSQVSFTVERISRSSITDQTSDRILQSFCLFRSKSTSTFLERIGRMSGTRLNSSR